MMDLERHYNIAKIVLFFYKIFKLLSGVLAIISAAIIIVIFWSDNGVISDQDMDFFFGSLVVFIISVSFWLILSVLIRDFIIELRDILNQIDLDKIDVTSIEARAEKLFKLHQYELEKYYNQNLRQGSQVFYGGLLFIIIGFIIIAISLYLVAYGEVENSGMVAILGAVGTVLSNFIAAIYLKMFSETTKSATSFHNRLVSTHNLMFSNFIASKIKNEDLRERTYSDVATHLGNMKFEKEESEVEEKGKDKTEEKK